jgi:filamentous hemagglutinin family protein
MEGKLARSRFGWLLLLGYAVGGLAVSVQAQVVPDGSLGAEGSVLTPGVFTESGQVDRIDGGASRGNNLFHSFADFNVSPGQRLYFANPTAIENIVSRVTGGRESSIWGTLSVLGDANLLIINPSSILFGSNANGPVLQRPGHQNNDQGRRPSQCSTQRAQGTQVSRAPLLLGSLRVARQLAVEGKSCLRWGEILSFLSSHL